MAYPTTSRNWSPSALLAEEEKVKGEASTSTLEKAPLPAEGPSRRIGIVAVLPGLAAVVVSWVLATAVLAWLFSKRITEHPSNEDQFFHGALVAVEGGAAPKHNADGSVIPESKLYGLTISSLAGTAIPLTIPILMGLYAFIAAAEWLNAQQAGATHALPTPPQYGMMLHIFNKAGPKTLYDYATFFRNPLPAAAQPVAALRKCFIILIVLLTFQYGIAAGDFWLHARTTSFIHHQLTPMAADVLATHPFGSAINTTTCPGPNTGPTEASLSAGLAYSCQTDKFEPVGGGTTTTNTWGDRNGNSLIGVAVTTMRGQYTSNRVYLVGDLAVISRPNLTTTVEGAVFETLAMKTQCKPADCSERSTGPGQAVYSCSSFSPSFEIVADGSSTSDKNLIQRFGVTDRSLWNSSYPLTSSINPTGVIAVLGFPTSASTPQGRLNNNSMPGWKSFGGGSGGHVDTFLAECTVTTYTVKVKLSNLPSQSLTLASEPIMTDFNTTSALTPAFETESVFAPMMITYLADQFRYADVSDENAFITAFSRNLSVAALGLASPLVLTQSISEGSFIDLVSASRYEWAPLFFYTGLLYIYGFAALLLCVVVAFALSPTVMHDNEPVKTAELLRLRLTDPQVLVADQFVDGRGIDSVGAKWSVQKGALKMYQAASDDRTKRLGAGVSNEHALRRRQTFGVEVLKHDDEELQDARR